MNRAWLSYCLLSILVMFTQVMVRAQKTEATKLTLTDGRTEQGRVTQAGSTIMLRDGIRTLYLSPAVVDKKHQVEHLSDPPVYTVNEERFKGLGSRRRMAMVQAQFQWGVPQPDGTLTFSSVDPKLGKVNGTLVIRRISPSTIRYECLEYIYTLEYPTRNYINVVKGYLQKELNSDQAEDIIKALRFFMAVGDIRSARSCLDRIEFMAGQADTYQYWKPRVSISELELSLNQITRLRNASLHRDALQLISRLQIDDSIKEVDPLLHAQSLKVKSEAMAEQQAIQAVKPLMIEAGLSMASFSIPALKQVHTLLIKQVEGAPLKDAAIIQAAATTWAGALIDEVALTEAQWKEAIQLAAQCAAYFKAGQPEGQSRALARTLELSKLPLNLRCSILAYARDYEDTPIQRWQRVEWEHPRERQTFYYVIDVPAQYDPARPWPVLVTLHGMNSTAEMMSRFWPNTASHRGMIVISPEYVYGRQSGFYASNQEHRAILGAVTHAAQSLNIDMDRVFLHGQSQGGHACWEIGGSQAARFAGVIPVIGAPLWPTMLANYKDTSVYAVGGELDGGAPVHSRKAMRSLTNWKTDAIYVEYDGRKHEAFFEEHDEIFQWISFRKRSHEREALNLLMGLDEQAWRDWIVVDQTSRKLASRLGNAAARNLVEVKASWVGHRVSIKSKGVKQLTLMIPPALARPGEELQISANRRRVKMKVEADWLFAINKIKETGDRQSIYLDYVQIRP